MSSPELWKNGYSAMQYGIWKKPLADRDVVEASDR
jgi:hypothetical protein